MDNDFWGEVIYAYTRKQAIDDGMLIDVTKTAKEAGFHDSTVITAALYERLQCTKKEKSEGQSYEGRLWDVLFVGITKVRAYVTARKPRGPFRLDVTITVREEQGNGKVKPVLMDYCVDFNLGDEGELVITIGFAGDF